MSMTDPIKLREFLMSELPPGRKHTRSTYVMTIRIGINGFGRIGGWCFAA